MPLTTAEIAAFVGAGAWLPQVFTWIHKATTRPKLTIIPAKAAEIGFTTFGPIFNLRLALAVDRNDIIVTKLSVRLIHENGEHREFSWQGMKQTFSAIHDRSGIQQGSVEKDQVAIALKIRTSDLAELFFRFQEDRFDKHVNPIQREAEKHRQYLESQKKDYHDEFLRSEKYCALVNAHKEFFWWRPGTYQVKFVAESSQKLRMGPGKFEFELTPADVDALRANLNLIAASYEQQVKAALPGYSGSPVRWAWRNPVLTTA